MESLVFQNLNIRDGLLLLAFLRDLFLCIRLLAHANNCARKVTAGSHEYGPLPTILHRLLHVSEFMKVGRGRRVSGEQDFVNSNLCRRWGVEPCEGSLRERSFGLGIW